MPSRRQLPAASAQAAAPARPRQVKPAKKQGRPALCAPAAETRTYGPTELADLTGYTRDAIHKMEGAGLERAEGGKGFTLPAFIRFIAGRERAAGRLEADPDDALAAELLRDKRAVADMREDQRDKQRLKLIEVELAQAVSEDDTAYFAVHLRSLGARLMAPLCTMDDPADICAVIDAEVERALENLNAAHVDPASSDAHPYVGGVAIEGRG